MRCGHQLSTGVYLQPKKHSLGKISHRSNLQLVSWKYDWLNIASPISEFCLKFGGGTSMRSWWITCPIVLKGSDVERVSSYKYLGIVIDDKLSWHVYIDSLIKRLNTRMYCLRKLNYFNVDVKILALFYDSVVESVWRYCLLCWGGNVSKGDRERVERIVKEAGKIIGVSRQDFGSVYTDLLIKKLHHVVDDASHPLHDCLSGQLITRSGRMRLPSVSTNRYLSSFVPQAIRFHNANYKRGDVHIEM